jgi:hypothetical protein
VIDPIRELKVRAEILHHAVEADDAAAVERLRALPEHKRATPDALKASAAHVQRKHCLSVVAREVGFASWDEALRFLEGDPAAADYGTLLYGADWGGRLNHWFAAYDEAKAHLDGCKARGEKAYLLAYKRHFFVAEAAFVDALGLDPDDADWQAIGWDWARPEEPAARARLYGKLLEAQRTLRGQARS